MGAGGSPTAERGSAPAPRHVAMSWARRLQRVFGVEIERCARCQGKLAIIASIEVPCGQRLQVAVSTRLRTSAAKIEIRSQADSCSHRPRVKPKPASDDNSQRETR